MHAPELRHLQPLYQRYAQQAALLSEMEQRFGLSRVDPAESRTQCPELALQLNEFLYEQGDWHAMAWLAMQLDMGAGDGLVYFLRSAHTVGQAITELVRLGPMLFPDGSIELIADAQAWHLRVYPLVHAERLGMLLRYEAISCWLVKVVHYLQGSAVYPLAAGLMTADRGSRELEAYLGPQISWGEDSFVLSWPAALWQVQLPNANPPLFTNLRAHFASFLDTVLANDTLAQQTCRYLLQKQRLTCAELPDVASALHLTVPQYRRQLAAEQTSFSRIQLELKRSQAVRRLLSGHQRLEVLAQELGFTERSAFERAFSNWFACTPSQFRRELQRQFATIDFPCWDSPHAWPFPLCQQAAIHRVLQAPELDIPSLAGVWQLNPKLCALLLAELNQPECGAISCEQISHGLLRLGPELVRSLGYAAMGQIGVDYTDDTQVGFERWRASYFLQLVCREQGLDPHQALSADWAAFFCLLAGGTSGMDLAYYSQRSAILLASWGVPHLIVRRLFLWGAEKSPEYAYLNAALQWAQQTSTEAADACWPALWQQVLQVEAA
ncbi:helix-turn-helix transcriptional regulator [Chitinibacter fontanus]|uniref:Helix-turn-helix transcriptional regulator n=1 Tax=Chitinibacter fontanus TaxID=1737446 RepID=A0A7D5ZDG3_9NEIS|nr:AraC family transcriptional regulator [Chitinibacter fontanus]QLI82045.1 helix-turn-helix transcriptional regulator [Chitinibacter fontanus]